jgi:hypothetical protein
MRGAGAFAKELNPRASEFCAMESCVVARASVRLRFNAFASEGRWAARGTGSESSGAERVLLTSGGGGDGASEEGFPTFGPEGSVGFSCRFESLTIILRGAREGNSSPIKIMNKERPKANCGQNRRNNDVKLRFRLR